jgi:small-conductance mechanosensitive channel
MEITKELEREIAFRDDKINRLSDENRGLNEQIQSLRSQNNELGISLTNERSNLNTERNTFTNERNVINNERLTYNSERQKLNDQIESLHESSSKERQFFNDEISKLKQENESVKNESKRLKDTALEDAKSIVENLASSYGKYADEISKTVSKWLGGVLCILVMVLLWNIYIYSHVGSFSQRSFQVEKINSEMSVIYGNSIDNQDLNWGAKFSSIFPSLLIDLVLIYILYFVTQQYLYQMKLLTEYRNRKVVAESYLGVLSNISDEEFKERASLMIVETLFSRASVELGSELPIKQALKIAQNAVSKNTTS